MFTYLGWVNQNIAIIFTTCIFTHVNNTLFGGGGLPPLVPSNALYYIYCRLGQTICSIFHLVKWSIRTWILVMLIQNLMTMGSYGSKNICLTNINHARPIQLHMFTKRCCLWRENNRWYLKHTHGFKLIEIECIWVPSKHSILNIRRLLEFENFHPKFMCGLDFCKNF